MNVLLTKKLSQDQLNMISSWGWNCEVVETLKITPVEVNEIPVKADVWIVSSRNSFAIIKKFIAEAPKQIYCVGDWMKNKIEKFGTTIFVKSFENMKSLVSELLKQDFQSLIYFCGDEHRKELEKGLKETKTKIIKVITHQSEMTFPLIERSFDAVFVFSPRSVESLLKHNPFSQQTIFACIGPTTTNYLHSRGIENTFTSSYPDSTILLTEFHNNRLAALSGQATQL